MCSRTGRARDEPDGQPRATTQAFLERSHLSPIPLVIVAQEMQQPMKGQDPLLDRRCVAVHACLTTGHAHRDGNVA